ncbi:MAG: serine protease Do [Planctomycetota bacterium]|jgi:S1-C subfamily serine protease
MKKNIRILSSTASLSLIGSAIGFGLAIGTAIVPRSSSPDTDEVGIATAREVSSAFEAASRQIAPSVVRIESFQNGGGGLVPAGQGSGVIIDADGLIATNAHVVRGSSALKIVLVDGRTFDGEIAGLDNETDLALVRIEAEDLVSAKIRKDRPARVGEWVIAVGNPLGLGHSVTAGIVSGRGRSRGITSYDNFIQTDAAINPGNSGGPLVDLDGNVLGINTAVIDTRSGGQGIGFAIPASMVSDVVDQLTENGRVSRGYLGVDLGEVSRDALASLGYKGSSEVRIAGVRGGGPAARAGLRSMDIIDRVDGTYVTTLQNLMAAIARVRPGTEVSVEVVRSGERRSFSVLLAERPDNLGRR